MFESKLYSCLDILKSDETGSVAEQSPSLFVPLIKTRIIFVRGAEWCRGGDGGSGSVSCFVLLAISPDLAGD